MTANASAHEHTPHINIRIDRTEYHVNTDSMTGTELRQLAGIGADLDLFEAVAKGDDLLITDAATVELKSGMRFFTAPRHINPGR